MPPKWAAISGRASCRWRAGTRSSGTSGARACCSAWNWSRTRRPGLPRRGGRTRSWRPCGTGGYCWAPPAPPGTCSRSGPRSSSTATTPTCSSMPSVRFLPCPTAEPGRPEPGRLIPAGLSPGTATAAMLAGRPGGQNRRMDEAVRAYIDVIAPEYRALFDRLHRLILAAHPDAALALSYQIPTYRVGNRRLYVGAWQHGLSVYGWQADRDAGFSARHPELKAGK